MFQGAQSSAKTEPGGDIHQFEDVMRELLGDDTELAAQFEKLASMAGNMGKPKGSFNYMYHHQISNKRHTKSQILNASRLILQLSLPNPL